MDKGTFVKIAVVAIALIFVFEMFAFGYLGRSEAPQGKAGTGKSTLAGVSEFDATISSYEPYLLAAKLSDEQRTKLKSLDGVEDVMASSNGYVVSLKTSKYIKPVYEVMAADNITAAAYANLQLPGIIPLTLENGSNDTALTGGSLVKMPLEPVFKEGDSVRVKMNVETEDGYLARYSVPSPVPVEVSFNSTATVNKLLFVSNVFTVPWDKRGDISAAALEAEYGKENVTYGRKDYVLLGTPLTPQEMITRKYDYVTYISENSITTAANFTDRTRIIADFGAVTFPVSTLEVRSVSPVSVGFDGTRKYAYSLRLSPGDYGFKDPEVLLALDRELAKGGEINVSVRALVLGKTVFAISDVKELR